MNCYIILALVVVSTQASTVGRGWGSSPSIPNVNANVQGIIQGFAAGSAQSNLAGTASAVGDLAQPAAVALATENAAYGVEGGEVDQTIIVIPQTGETYTDNNVFGENVVGTFDETIAAAHGTSAQATNVAGGDAYGAGELSGAAATNTQVTNAGSGWPAKRS